MTEPADPSAIGNLPIELLESILLLVVEDARLCCLESEPGSPCEMYRCGSMDQLFDFRLTCRNFRNASWRALAEVIADTKFDVASRNSVENLKAISQSEQLAQWIQKLTITCQIAHPTFPLEILYISKFTALDEIDRKPLLEYQPEDLRPEDLCEDLKREFEAVKEQERRWHPETFSVWQDVDLDPFDDMGDATGPPFLSLHPASDCSLVGTLMGYLRRFKNLKDACYFHQQDVMPARYQELFKSADRYETDLLRNDVHETFTRLNAHMGLEIFMGALAASNTNVRRLVLSVQIEELHAFLSGLPIDMVTKACHKVETLVLRNKYYDYYGKHGLEPRVMLTQPTFPALRSLIIEGPLMADLFGDHSRDAPRPPPTVVPPLSHLTICGPYRRTDSMLQFLHHYGAHLHDLVLHSAGEFNYGPLFNVLGALSLVRLEFIVEDEAQWRHYLERPKGQRYHCMQAVLQNCPRELLLSSAKTVVLEPYFRQALDEHWQ